MAVIFACVISPAPFPSSDFRTLRDVLSVERNCDVLLSYSHVLLLGYVVIERLILFVTRSDNTLYNKYFLSANASHYKLFCVWGFQG